MQLFLDTERVPFSFAYKLCGEGAKLNTFLADNEKDLLSKLTLREVRATLADQATRPPSSGICFMTSEQYISSILRMLSLLA